jgi:hypothetical protein
MDELQKLMGDSYKEGLTIDDISTFLKGKNFADLSKGGYVDVNKYNSEIANLNNQIKQKDNDLKSKMTDDEKATAFAKSQEDEINKLKQLLAETQMNANKSTVNGTLAESLGILGLKSDDNDFVSFVGNITTEDSTKTSSIAKYVNKIVKDAYEKGKKDATKDALGDFGKQKGGSTTQNEIGKLGKELAEANKKNNNKKYNYFE